METGTKDLLKFISLLAFIFVLPVLVLYLISNIRKPDPIRYVDPPPAYSPRMPVNPSPIFRPNSSPAATPLIPSPKPLPAAIPKNPDAYVIPVLDLSYIPTLYGKVDVSLTGDWRDENVQNLESNINKLRNQLVDALTRGSMYHGYKDTFAKPSLNYEIVDKRIFYTAPPKSQKFTGMDNAASPDHIKILNDLNICDYVDNKGVKEVWVWMYHTNIVAPIESNMSGPYGDISNSARVDDLPKCKKTYTVYDYNYGRAVAMALENHTHQIEGILRNVDTDLFWGLFVGQNYTGGRCGWTHFPPNGRRDYDWANETEVASDCEDWKPDGGGIKKQVSCRTWSTDPLKCDGDEGLSFKIWWMQNIPGKDNGLVYNGRKLKNWWEFIGDFDNAMKDKSLVK